MNYGKCWQLLKNVFPVLDNSFQTNQQPENEFYEVASIIKNQHLEDTVEYLIITKIEEELRNTIAPNFWSHFKEPPEPHIGFQQFYNAIKSLHNDYIVLEDISRKIELIKQADEETHYRINNKNEGRMKLLLKATLLSQLPLDYQKTIKDFYECALRIEDKANNKEENDNDEDEDDDICDEACLICQARESCNCLVLFHEINQKLGEMGLLESLVGQTLTNLIYNYIKNHIEKICKDSFDSSYISLLEKWLEAVVLRWLKTIYLFDTNCSNDSILNLFDKKLKNYLYNSYTKIRIDQLFNIIIEYPESLAALEDLKICLPRTDLKPVLTSKLQKAMETRLLHPGVSTPDIVTAYVATIRSLRVLDPTGLLLETVTQPVHQYLRSREDTVRCIVSSLTEEGTNDLAEELIRGEAVQVDENTPVDEDEENWETWVPDPIDTAPNKSSGSRRTSDIISMLVNVYGSKELFVNEYRTLLADRLLSQYSCDTEKEIRYLELLKLRFGDSQLHYCEVMLKDIADSKRINQHIQQDPNYTEQQVEMSAMIVSSKFWPVFKEEKLQLHQKIVNQMEVYTSAFETLKGSRTLCWKNHLGMVDLEIELADRTLNLSVSPIHATIMMHFEDKATWELEELSKVMQCPPTVLRRKIGFWQSHGVLIETAPDVFHIKEDSQHKDAVQDDIFVEDFEAESAMASAEDQREEELQTFWSYIVGMLMNLDTLPLDRIHQMLKMFAFQGPTIECSLQELKVFLDRKVKEHQLIYSNGLYKLPK